jgi:hypothetical protein
MAWDPDVKHPLAGDPMAQPDAAGDFTSPILSSDLLMEGVLVSDGRIAIAGTIEISMAVTSLQGRQLVSVTKRFRAAVSGSLDSNEVKVTGEGQFRARLKCTSMRVDEPRELPCLADRTV